MIDVAIAVSRPRQPGSIFTQIGWSLAGLLVLLLAAAAAEPLLIQRAEKNMIEIGGADLGLAQGWSAKEFSDTLPGPNGPISAVYRWSGPSSSLVFARTGQQQPQIVTLRLLAGRPDQASVGPVRLSANGQPLVNITVGPALRHYHIFVPGELMSSQSLTLQIDVPAFRPPHNMSRLLGLIGLESRIDAVGAVLWRPRPLLALFVLSLVALLLANGVLLWRAALLAALALLLAIWVGFYAPGAMLASARTLFQLCLAAALVVGGARWWHWSGRRLRHPWRWASVLLVGLTLLTFTPTMSADGIEYYAYLRSLAVDHDLDFRNEYVGSDVPFKRAPTSLARKRTSTGYVGNLASVGPAIVWAPFYLVGDAIVRAGNAFGARWTTRGYSLPYIAMINLASAVSLPLTAWL
jgi:hypothetical protein